LFLFPESGFLYCLLLISSINFHFSDENLIAAA
jgi:hypothetical protein